MTLETDRLLSYSEEINFDYLNLISQQQLTNLSAKQHLLRMLLNKEFNEKEMNNLVSYIYYPYCGDVGHSELEIDGDCWNPKRNEFKPLHKKIKKTKKEKIDNFVFPFFRFTLSVSPTQLHKLKEKIDNNVSSHHCSYSSLSALQECCDFNVPFAFKVMPSLSALYLMVAKKLKINRRIKTIELYKSDNPHKNHSMLKGICKELCAISFLPLLSLVTAAIYYGETDSCPAIDLYHLHYQ